MHLAHATSGRFVAAVASIAVVVGAVIALQGAPAAGTCAVLDDGLDPEERAFVALINEYRAANGASTLTVSTTLTRASRNRRRTSAACIRPSRQHPADLSNH